MLYIKLRAIRKAKNISVKDLSKAIGKNIKTYYKKESGKLKFSLLEIQIIANIVQMPVEDIFFNNELSKTENEAV